VWLVAAVAGALAVVTGLVSPHSAGQVLDQVGPVLLFLAGITVVAELADAAGVFTADADRAARLGGGSVRRLFALILVLGTATTLVLSLDTTAVLLTPVVLVLADRLGISPIPFAMATVWLANTASLLLPASNLTNLLAMRSLGLSVTGFAAHTWLPAIAALAVTVLVLAVRYRRDLAGRYEIPAREPSPVGAVLVIGWPEVRVAVSSTWPGWSLCRVVALGGVVWAAVWSGFCSCALSERQVVPGDVDVERFGEVDAGVAGFPFADQDVYGRAEGFDRELPGGDGDEFVGSDGGDVPGVG